MSAVAFEEVLPAAVPALNRPKRERAAITLDGKPVYITNAMPHTPLKLGPVWLVPGGHALMTGRVLEMEIAVKATDGTTAKETVSVELPDTAIRLLRRWKANGTITTTGGTDLDGHEEQKRPAGSRQILAWGASQ